MITGIHHFAYAVSSISESVSAFEKLGWHKVGEQTDDEYRHVRIQFMEFGGERIELVASLDEKSPVAGLLDKNNGSATLYHICYMVYDIQNTIDELKKKGFLQTCAVAPAPAIKGKNVVFMYSIQGGVLELVEETL